MAPSARLFHCARCHCQVIVCRRCDRGNVYCFNGCAREARKASQRDATIRYRRSHRGRLANAARQRRYRARQQKVTHQGSDPADDIASLQRTATKPVMERSITLDMAPQPTHCHRCGCPVSVYVRHHFLHTGVHRRRPP